MAGGGHLRRRVHGGDVCGPLVLLFFSAARNRQYASAVLLYTADVGLTIALPGQSAGGKGKNKTANKAVCGPRPAARRRAGAAPHAAENESQSHVARLSSAGASIHTLTTTGRQATGTHERVSLLLLVIDIVVLLSGALCRPLSLA